MNLSGFSTKDLSKALDYQFEALEIYINKFGEVDDRTAIAYNNLAISYRNKKEWSEAERKYKKVLEIEDKLKLDDLQHASHLLNFSIFYKNNYSNLTKNEVEQKALLVDARQLCSNALVIYREKSPKIKDKIHPDILTCNETLAQIEEELNKY
jgi:tetratricopeptide (TPR) repeat protein